MLKYFQTALIILVFSNVHAQFLIENNNSEQKSKLKVKSETGYYIMPDGSKCLMWIKEFNPRGLLTSYQDYWQCGQSYWNYGYEYNQTGKCVASFKSSYKENFKRMPMRHIFNASGQLVARIASDSIGYPAKEHYAYDASGNITSITFSGEEKNGEKHPWSKTWNGDKTYRIVEKEPVYDENEKLKWTVVRAYKFYQ